VTLEPVSRPSPNDGPRGVSGQLTERARRLVDLALDRVFDEPYEIHSEDDFERVMSEHRATMSFMSAGALAGFVERALPLAKLSTKAGKRVPLPAIKYTIAAIPIAMQLGNSVRHGIREVQVLASYLIHRLRQVGVEPERGLVTALALSISLDPERRPDLRLTPARAGAGLARLWIMRSMRKESGKSVARRARSEAAAVDRLDFRAVAKDWEARLA
jgi:hypothetical protein